MKRLVAALALLMAANAGARAAAPIWSNTAGGFPAWYGSPTFSSNAYTLSSPLPTWPQYSLVTQQHVRIIIPSGGTNSGAATLNVNGTGALPIVANTESGLSALVGGELQAGLEYDFTYSTSSATACSSSCYVVSWLAGSAVLAATTQTVTAGQWASVTVFDVTTSSQTLTLPASSGLSVNGGIFINTTQSVTLTPNSGDSINGGPAGASITIVPNAYALVTKSSAGSILVAPTGIAYLNQADQTVSGGANVTSDNLGTQSSGTLTIDCGARPLQYATNNGAFTLAAPSNDGSCLLFVTNGSSAGTITFSGFSEGANTGDTLTTTNGSKFTIDIWRIDGTAGYRVAAHQ
jgi:hypothetical protein